MRYLLLFLMFAPFSAHAQSGAFAPVVQLGAGLLPGIGVQTIYVRPALLWTTEVALTGDYTPEFSGGEGTYQVNVGVGGSIRLLGVARLFGEDRNPGTEFDLGFRIGPSLSFFTGSPTRAQKNRTFGIYTEPYLRLVRDVRPGIRMYGEAGVQKPFLRGGFWINLP
jgi:hypothetical protein